MGTIKVTVQTEKRLQAITNMAIAIKHLAKALGIGTHVAITDCTIVNSAENGISVNTTEETTETKIEKIE